MNSLYLLNNIIVFILLPLPGVYAIGNCSPTSDCSVIIKVLCGITAALAGLRALYLIYYKIILGHTKDKKSITTTSRNRPIAIRRPPPTFSNRPIIENTYVDENITSTGSLQLQRSEVELLPPPPSYPDSQTNNSADHIVLNIINAEERRDPTNHISEVQTLQPPPPYYAENNSRSNTNMSS